MIHIIFYLYYQAKAVQNKGSDYKGKDQCSPQGLVGLDGGEIKKIMEWNRNKKMMRSDQKQQKGCTSDQTLGKAMEREWKGNKQIRFDQG